MLQVLALPVPTLPRLVHRDLGACFLVLAALDVLVTSVVLRAGGTEANIIARFAIEHGGLAGMLALKIIGTGTVLAICEYISRTRAETGRRVLMLAVALNILAVGMGSAILGLYAATVLAYL